MTKENIVDLSGKFYLWAPNILGEGSIVLPGNFGKNTKGNNFNTGAYMLCRELIFEQARLNTNPSCVSRLSCIFLFSSLEDATTQKNTLQSLAPVLYEVSAHPNAKIFRHDMRYLSDQALNTDNANFYHSVYKVAEKYWRIDEPTENPVYEFLTDSPVRIERALEGY